MINEDMLAAKTRYEESVARVKAKYPRATAMSDYNYETCWSIIYDNFDEDGLACGNILGTAQFEGDAWVNAARGLK